MQNSRYPKPSRHRGGRPFSNNANELGRQVQKFAKTKSMPSSKSMNEYDRQKGRVENDCKYLGAPPPGQNLISARLVLPQEHLLPSRLEDPRSLDEIRSTHQVFITSVAANILEIQADSVLRLQNGLRAVNWAIHDMRLSSEHPAIRFVIQTPSKATSKDLISYAINCRPHFMSIKQEGANVSALDSQMQRLSADISVAGAALMALKKDMKMRINFGHIIVRQKKRGVGEEITQDQFAQIMRAYSVRGGASLKTGFHDIEQAQKAFRFLADPKNGVWDGFQEITQAIELTVGLQDHEIIADCPCISGRSPRLSMVRAKAVESWPRLNWTFAVPETELDWNLRVDAWESVDTPDAFRDLSKMVTLKLDDTQETPAAAIRIPKLGIVRLSSSADQIQGMRLKTTALIPFGATPYIIEISVTKSWVGAEVKSEPVVTWGMEVYAKHWDERINSGSEQSDRTDWGGVLKSLWPGEEPDLHSRFARFLRTILEIQAILVKACD